MWGTPCVERSKQTEEDWALELRERVTSEAGDSAFFGQHNLLNQDQGIRTLLQVMNDLCLSRGR